MFVIVETFARLCPSTDAIVGSTSRIVESGIVTPAWAAKRAGILADRDAPFGDSAFYARDAADPFNRNRSFPTFAPAIGGDEIPF